MVFGVKNAYFLSESAGKKMTEKVKECSYSIPANLFLWKITSLSVKYGLFGFLSYGSTDGDSLREGVAFLPEEELLLGIVEVGLANVDAEVEDLLPLSLLAIPSRRDRN